MALVKESSAFADFGSGEMVWIREGGGFRIARRQKSLAGENNTQIQVIASAVFATRVRTGGLTLNKVYTYFSQATIDAFNQLSSGLTVYLRDSSAANVNSGDVARYENYALLSNGLGSSDRFYDVPFKIDNVGIVDQKDGTSIVTVSVSAVSAWEDEA